MILYDLPREDAMALAPQLLRQWKRILADDCAHRRPAMTIALDREHIAEIEAFIKANKPNAVLEAAE